MWGGRAGRAPSPFSPSSSSPPTHSDAKQLLSSIGATPPRVKPLADVVAEYVALVAGARARATLAAAHPALATVLASIDGAAGAPPVPEDVFGVRQVGGGGGAGPPSPPPPPPPLPHDHDDPAALRSPRRALRKRPPARYVPPSQHAGLDPVPSLPWHRTDALTCPPLDGAASIDLLLDAPLSADALLALLADDDAAARFAASLAPRLAAATEAADLVADPEVATLLQPLVGGGGGGGGGGLRRRPSMPPPPPRPSRLGREGGGGGGGGDNDAPPADRADIDDDRLEAFLGGLSYD